jgi:U4/U6.U5 tri-snRNP-associated protein 2
VREKAEMVLKKYRLKVLPEYVILVMKRFTRNNFYKVCELYSCAWVLMRLCCCVIQEKNPTIVNFPVKGLDLGGLSGEGEAVRYDLVANVFHDGLPGSIRGSYHVHVCHEVRGIRGDVHAGVM